MLSVCLLLFVSSFLGRYIESGNGSFLGAGPT